VNERQQRQVHLADVLDPKRDDLCTQPARVCGQPLHLDAHAAQRGANGSR
jgi:hypothetical protein